MMTVTMTRRLTNSIKKVMLNRTLLKCRGGTIPCSVCNGGLARAQTTLVTISMNFPGP